MRHSEPPLPGFVLLLGALVQTVGIGAARAEDLPVVNDVDLQPLAAKILRVVEALDILGQPWLQPTRPRSTRPLTRPVKGPACKRSRKSWIDIA